MEERVLFAKADLTYLANLCHNCGECLYACQFAPPHEFGINVPQTLARIRVRSYENHSWPPALGAAFRHHGVATALGLVGVLTLLMLVATWVMNPEGLRPPSGDFYAVVPHGVMVSLFGGVGIFVLVALGMGLRGFWREVQSSPAFAPARLDGRFGAAGLSVADTRHALRDALTLRHLHTTGVDCTTAEDTRRPWRRWFHHCTLYGFMLCFASTSVAAIYHIVFGWHAPYAYTSLPVLLGTVRRLGSAGWSGWTPRGPATAGSRSRRRRSERAGRGLHRSLVVDQSDRSRAACSARSGGHGRAARDPPRRRARVVSHAAVRQVRARHLPHGRAPEVCDRVTALERSEKPALRGIDTAIPSMLRCSYRSGKEHPRCEATIRGTSRCLATSRRSSACAPITRCGRFGV